MTDRRDLPASDAKLRRIAAATAEWFGVDGGPWASKSTIGIQSARARQVAMYLMRQMTNASYERIAKILHRHHSTVMHGEAATANEMAINLGFCRCVGALRRYIRDEDKSARSATNAVAFQPPEEQKERATETA